MDKSRLPLTGGESGIFVHEKFCVLARVKRDGIAVEAERDAQVRQMNIGDMAIEK